MIANAEFERRYQRWLILGLLLVTCLFCVQYLIKIGDSERTSRSAFLRWRVQIEKLDAGENIWETYTYPNPPIMALILKPFMALPARVGAVAWFFFKVGLTILAVTWLLRLLDRPDQTFPLWGKALTILLSLKPITGDLIHGNVNLFILFLVTACLYAFCTRRDFWAGLALGLAIACKLTPALFVPYFLWKRAGKTLLGTATGLILFLWLVPGLCLGFQRNEEALTSWCQQMVTPFVIEGKVITEHQNQSLPGLVNRLFATKTSEMNTSEESEPTLFDSNDQVLRGLILVCMAGFSLLVVIFCRTPTEARPPWQLLAEFSIVALGMLLFSERTWKHHCVLLLLPFALLCYAASAHLVLGRGRTCVFVCIALAGVLMLCTSTGYFDRQKLAEYYGAYAAAHLILLACTLFVLTGANRSIDGY